MLAVVSSHPVQYHAPVFRYIQQQFGIPTTVVYGSDFSVVRYFDEEFGSTFAWDTDLLSGYSSVFLTQVRTGGARNYDEVTALGVYDALRRINPDAVLLLGYGSSFHRGVFWAAWRLGRPLLLRAETTDHAVKRSRAKRILRDLALRAFYKQFDALLYIGKRSYNHYRRLGVEDSKLIFSPYCVDTQLIGSAPDERLEIRRSMRHQLGLDPTMSVLLYSGKLVHRKGPDLLLDAYDQLPQEVRVRCAIIFVGEGDLRGALEGRSCAHSNVHFVGFQNQTQLSDFYEMADLLVMPSRTNETWGLVVNEALSHGLPCVVSDQVGCNPDLIFPGRTGEVFASESISSLAAAIMRGIELCRREVTADECRHTVSRYSIEQAASGIASAYQQVIQASSG
jgi:glycosyltransferase involved in cell wall biosynthesis